MVVFYISYSKMYLPVISRFIYMYMENIEDIK